MRQGCWQFRRGSSDGRFAYLVTRRAPSLTPFSLSACLRQGFCDRLFNTVNWAVTEGTVAVAALHEARRPAAATAAAAIGPVGSLRSAASRAAAAAAAHQSSTDEQQLVRKVGRAFMYCYSVVV